ncbi:MAG TPA: hypothetical protein VFD43_00315 [Planctomycetota bacterium]|nr:hypothetical protein [Planctomycetota bacterium]
MTPRPAAALSALRRAALVLGLAGAAAAQFAPGASERPPVLIHHSFPLAGETLAVVIEGLDPAEDVVLRLDDPAAPPSLLEYLADPTSPQQVLPAVAGQASLWTADDHGRIALAVPLDDPADAGQVIALSVVRDSSTGEAVAAGLALRVQPPTLVLLADQGLVRIDLRDGALLDPSIPGPGGLRGMALESTGASGYLLREGGRLELRSADDWDGEPLSVAALDAFSDTLAGSLLGGAAFVLSRPPGEPFTPGARLQFLGAGAGTLLLEPMGQELQGRRAVVSGDGLTAFVAEDDLLVREVDLLSREPRGLIAAGLPGDRQIADLLLDGRRLLVATRGAAGRPGALTILELDSGSTAVWPLQIDPLRLVALEPGLALVVPASGSAGQVIESGVPSRLLDQPGTTLLDAAAIDGAALLLRASPEGTLLQRAQAGSGRTVTLVLPAPLPAVERLAGRGEGVVVLLDDPDGLVHVVDPSGPSLRTLPGVSSRSGAPFVILP